MDHTKAMEMFAPERYLLNEMTDDERDSFEAHFFDCFECAADVRAGAMMVSGVKAMPEKVNPWSKRVAWLASAASLVLSVRLGVITQVTLPALRQAVNAAQQETAQPHRVLSYELSTSTLRSGPSTTAGSDQTVKPVEHGVEPVFVVAVTPVPGAQGYELTIVDATGHPHGTHVRVTADDAAGPVFVPGGSKLKPGRYSIKVKALPAGELAETAKFDVF